MRSLVYLVGSAFAPVASDALDTRSSATPSGSGSKGGNLDASTGSDELEEEGVFQMEL